MPASGQPVLLATARSQPRVPTGQRPGSAADRAPSLLDVSGVPIGQLRLIAERGVTRHTAILSLANCLTCGMFGHSL